ncbi:MAG: FMN-binding protein [Gammaproteobacteria bacterium]|nr:FMN-binding protein [Gammaproteobacteria bacterium]MDH5802943.1 FMN-binding protein [Gammaproteobacteria bacterium]
MSQSQIVQLQTNQTPQTPGIMFLTLTLMGLICAALLAVVYMSSAPTIEKNQQQLLQQSIQELFPHSTRFRALQMDASGKLTLLEKRITQAHFYEVLDRHDILLGYSVRASGMGYQDNIALLYAYRPQTQIISGYEILSSRETPGLGTKIETDQHFKAQFDALPVPLTDNRQQLRKIITLAKKGKKPTSGELDSITGATISSRSLIQTVSKSSALWVPRLHQLATGRNAPTPTNPVERVP